MKRFFLLRLVVYAVVDTSNGAKEKNISVIVYDSLIIRSKTTHCYALFDNSSYLYAEWLKKTRLAQ
ncbi:MAG: hypothetical protein LBG05_03520 [Treponema sp.]|jgi:ABC-type xylose transport system substrate-binding protein|nr:hypothetical protein [Treponema sp.]